MMLKFIGGTFLIIGSVIGGGILAIPIMSAQFGFWITLCVLVCAWGLMMKTGLYVLDLCLCCSKLNNSYYSMMGKFLGVKVQVLTVFAFLWLLYFALSSYISGFASFMMSHISTLSYTQLCLLYVAILGSLVTLSAKLIVRLNVLMVLLKLGLLLTIIVLSTHYYSPFVTGFSLLKTKTLMQSSVFSLIFVIINAFGYQFILPSLVSYYSKTNAYTFKWMIVTSTTLVLLLYIAWLYTIDALLPTEALLSISHSSNQLLALNTNLQLYMHSLWATHVLNAFEVVALVGSFFCVALSVFDFLCDVFKTQNRFIVGLATFVPPLILTTFSENMYVYAISVAGYISIVLEVILPICANKKRLKESRQKLQ